MEKFYKDIAAWLNNYPLLFEVIKIAFVLFIAALSFLIVKKIFLSTVHKIIKKTKTDIDDILFEDKTLHALSYIVPLMIIDWFSYLFGKFSTALDVITDSFVVIVVLISLNSFINSIIKILARFEKLKDKPIKGYFQVVKIILFVWGGIILIGILTGESPWTLLGGLSAMTAVLLLIFRDTILSFVASIQISSYDLVKLGDWIEVPQYGADGDVIDISLNVIKVQNWDKTITVMPTYKLIDGTFKNWRGMVQTGGRRIARSINIDMNSIKFCDEEMIERFKKIQLLKPYLTEKVSEIEKWNSEKNIESSTQVNGRRITNIGTFRAYLKAYLNQREDIHKGLTFLIRQLAPNEHGVPIQIYVFATTTAWVEYEDIQSDIFDHIFAVIPHFDLRVYQSPSGGDFKDLSLNSKVNK